MEDKSSKIGLIIQARLGSKRFPGKLLMPFGDSHTVIQYLLNRLRNLGDSIPVIVATSNKKEDDQIVDILKRDEHVAVFRGEENNVLDRFVRCSIEYNLKKIIRICADNPFLDIDSVKQLVTFMKNNSVDYVSFFIDGKPAIKTHFGLWAEGVSLNALERVASLTNEKKYLEHVTNYIYENSQDFKISKLAVPDWFPYNYPIRLTIDTEKDYLNLCNVCMQLKDKEISIENIIRVIIKDNALMESMSKEIIFNQK